MRVRALLDELTRQYHWTVEVKQQKTEHLIEGKISSKDWHMILTLHPQGEVVLAQQLGLQAEEAEAAFERMVYAVFRHEIGHWQYCPFDGAGQATILEGVAEGLQRKPLDHRGEVVQRVANMFCDLIVNTSLAYWDEQRKHFLRGSILYFLHQLCLPGDGDEYALFVAVQSRLFPEPGPGPEAARFRQRTGAFSQKIKRAAGKAVGILLAPEHGRESLMDRRLGRQRL